MSTLDSWIDRDELASLLADLVPTSPPAAGEPADAPAPPASNESGEDAPPDADRPEGGADSPFTPADSEMVEAAAENGPKPTENAEPETAPPPPEPVESAIEESGESHPLPETESLPAFHPLEAPLPSQALQESDQSVELEEPDEPETAESVEPAGENDDTVESVSYEAIPAEPEPPASESPDLEADLEPAPESEVAPAAAAPPPRTQEESEPLDFDVADAYQASPFPGPESPGENAATSPLRRTAAVQASEALERARSRAQEAGLLKAFAPPVSLQLSAPHEAEAEVAVPLPDSSPLGIATPATPETNWDETPPDEVAAETETRSAEPEAEAELPSAFDKLFEMPSPAEPETPFESPEPGDEAADLPEDEPAEPTESALPETEPAASGEAPISPVVPLRQRLLAFVERAGAATGSPEIAVTDFQSYPLLSGGKAAPAAHSALRLSHWFGNLSHELHASRDGLTQISLGTGEWLCVISAESASGGVCASFRVAEPISTETARNLSEDLRATLRESPVLAAAS